MEEGRDPFFENLPLLTSVTGKQRHMKCKRLARGHTAWVWQRQDATRSWVGSWIQPSHWRTGTPRPPGRSQRHRLRVCALLCCLSWHFCCCSVAQSCPTLSAKIAAWIAACQASLTFTVSWNLPKFMSIELVMPSKNLILCCLLVLSPSISPSIRVFSNELALHIRWNFSFSISPSNEYSALISFRIDWFDLLAVQGTLKSLLQHHNSNFSQALWILVFLAIGWDH